MSPPRVHSGWVLGPRADLAVFGGPVLLAAAFVALASARGFLHAPLPPWAFAALIVGCDVAHVWATAFRVYLDPEELRRRLPLYLGVPLLCFAGGVALYAESSALFWRGLAYLAAFHFVRQQWGWIAYSRARAGERGGFERVLDEGVLYAVTALPVLWWHANLPRGFVWFVEGDFAALPSWVGSLALGLHWLLLAVYGAWQAFRLVTGRGVNAAKLFLLATTWVAWYGGIVHWNSDLAFTAFNVLSHGIPYLVIVWRVERERWRDSSVGLARLFRPGRAAWFVLALVALGYAEEWLWDRSLWREHPTLFAGPALELAPSLFPVLIPLLALPQATHYVLDAWIWRRGRHRELQDLFGSSRGEGHE